MKSFFHLILLIILISCNNKKPQFEIDEAYKTSFEENLLVRAENRINYLQLTGLFMLDSLENTFGKDKSNDFVLYIENLPSTLGIISVYKDSIVFSAEENVEVKTNQDSIINNSRLELDEYGSSIELFHNQLSWQVITRSNHFYLRVWDTKNPAIETFKGFDRFPLNSEFIFEGQFTYYETIKSEIVKSEVDGQRSTTFIGKIEFKYHGETHDLEVGEGGFTMVSDETTGNETYGGGRYIYVDLPGTNGTAILDLNYLYNPPCAFSKFTTCLYPPRQNHLPFKVMAGEQISNH